MPGSLPPNRPEIRTDRGLGEEDRAVCFVRRCPPLLLYFFLYSIPRDRFDNDNEGKVTYTCTGENSFTTRCSSQIFPISVKGMSHHIRWAYLRVAGKDC